MKGVQEKSKTAHFGPKMSYFPHFEHNKRLFLKNPASKYFCIATTLFQEKKKKSDKDFLKKKYFSCSGPKSINLFLLILSMIGIFQNKQYIKMISKHDCLTLSKKSKREQKHF